MELVACPGCGASRWLGYGDERDEGPCDVCAGKVVEADTPDEEYRSVYAVDPADENKVKRRKVASPAMKEKDDADNRVRRR